jgi:hypothetical protein
VLIVYLICQDATVDIADIIQVAGPAGPNVSRRVAQRRCSVDRDKLETNIEKRGRTTRDCLFGMGVAILTRH